MRNVSHVVHDNIWIYGAESPLGRLGGSPIGGRARMAELSRVERTAFAKQGAAARWASMSEEERRAQGRKAARARWATKKTKKKANHP